MSSGDELLMCWQQAQVQKRRPGMSIYEHRTFYQKKKRKRKRPRTMDTYALCKNVVQLGILDGSKECDGCVLVLVVLCVPLALVVLVREWGLALVCSVFRHYVCVCVRDVRMRCKDG